MGRILSRDVEIQRKRLGREVGTVRKDWGGRLPIALCYPNSYAVGMCNLGFQSVYNLFNSARGFVCERVFAEPVLIGSRTAGRADWTGDDKYRIQSRLEALGEPLSVESQRPLTVFAVDALNARDVNDFRTMSAVLSPDIELGDMFLLEMTRGCARGCRFCLAGYTSLPVRHRHVDHLMEGVEHGLKLRKRIGLISAATSDHPQLEQLLSRMLAAGAEVSLSSLRIDRISPFLVEALVLSGTKTITLAPEAGSQRMRDVINKRLTHEQIVQAAVLAGKGGIPKAKLYFIVGLPGETHDDVRELAALSAEILGRMREHNRGARVAVNLSPHVPKAQTAFQWEPMASVETSDERIKLVQRALGPLGIDVRFEAPASQRVQAILARADRRVTPVLLETSHLQQFEANLVRHGLDPEFYLGTMDPNGIMPWALVSTGVPEWHLKQEFGRSRGLGGQAVPFLDLPPKAAAVVAAARLAGTAA